MTNNSYNPDVLNCIANLSNDEVFTPPELANKMLDLLPQELFRSPATTFLDPFTKSGVFLREIVKRLDRGLADVIPDRRQRIDHILHRQVFGIACTELTSLLARRSVYCSKTANGPYSISKFDTPDGNILYKNIRHTWVNGKCKYCGASQAVYDRGSEAEQYAYMFIHTDNPKQFFPNMKFDVIIGNPPYQLSSNNSGIQATPLYHLFVQQAKLFHPKYISIIIPSRWFSGGMGMDEFRREMLNETRIRIMVDYPKSRDCFSGVDIAGGVCYFLWDRDYKGDCIFTSIYNKQIIKKKRKLNEYNILIRDNIGIDIVHKVPNIKNLSAKVFSIAPFGIGTKIRGASKEFEGSIKLVSSSGNSFIPLNQVLKNQEIIDKYKVIIGQLNPDRGGVNNSSDGKINVTTKIGLLYPNEVHTATYLLLGAFSTAEEAKNFITYVKTILVRYLISLTLSSMHITKDSFQFVPLQDFSHPWTDEMLYKKYGLTPKEIAFIESMIRPME